MGQKADTVISSDDKRVLILGSGSSRASDFQLPTMTEFFSDGLSEWPELDEFLKWFYGDLPRSQYNVEEVLAYLDLSQTRLPLWSTHERPKYAGKKVEYTELIRYVRKKLVTPEDEVCGKHKDLVSKLNKRDTILTFNYDLIADRALLNIEPKEHGQPAQDSRMGKLQALLGKPNLFWGGSPPTLIPRELESGFYLKLHGSLDWLYCPRANCPNNMNFWALSVAELAAGQTEGLPCRICGSALQIFLVPPIATKRIEDTGRVAFLWNLALRELHQADRVAVIGLSFAPSDFELRWLIRQAVELRGLTRNLHVAIVNPSEDDRKRALGCFPTASIDHQDFEDISQYIRALDSGQA